MDVVAIGRRRERQSDSSARSALLESVYRTRSWELRVLADRLLRGSAGGEDLVQEAFARTYASRRQFETESDLMSYVAKAVINLARGRFRRERSGRAAMARLRVDARAAAKQVDEPVWVQDDVLIQAIDLLPRRQREVVLLRYWLDLSVEQAARALNITTGSVKTHCSRAVQALRLALEGDAQR